MHMSAIIIRPPGRRMRATSRQTPTLYQAKVFEFGQITRQDTPAVDCRPWLARLQRFLKPLAIQHKGMEEPEAILHQSSRRGGRFRGRNHRLRATAGRTFRPHRAPLDARASRRAIVRARLDKLGSAHYASTVVSPNRSSENQLRSCLRDESPLPSICRPAVRPGGPAPRPRRAASVAQGAHMARKGADRTRELVRY